MAGPWLLLGAGAVGWVWGSFLNTLVDRTPRRDGTGPRLGWLTPPRSLCLACGAPVAWFDNLPIVSYLVLRGRCRACHAAIGRRTLVVELATPVLAIGLAAGLVPNTNWAWALWAAGALSTVIVGVPTLLERRRPCGIAGALLGLTVLGLVLVGLR